MATKGAVNVPPLTRDDVQGRTPAYLCACTNGPIIPVVNDLAAQAAHDVVPNTFLSIVSQSLRLMVIVFFLAASNNNYSRVKRESFSVKTSSCKSHTSSTQNVTECHRCSEKETHLRSIKHRGTKRQRGSGKAVHNCQCIVDINSVARSYRK